MMWCTLSFLLLLGTFSTISNARPTELQDIFQGFVKNVNLYSPEKQSEIVKRRIYEENPDSDIKQVSLQSLIGDLEQNFYQSASSASSLVHATGQSEEHPIAKRKVEDVKENVDTGSKKEVKASSKEVTVVSTEKIPAKDGAPTHLLVDHISVQPHYGDLPIVPAFALQHTKVISATIKDNGSNNPQITITKANVHTVPVQITTVTQKNKDEKKVENDSTTTTEKPQNTNGEKHSTTTTQKSLADIKKAEAELKEKVAEIEAEPVILSARV